MGKKLKGDLISTLFKNHYSFSLCKDLDQDPITQESAIFITKKILDNIPIQSMFHFIGDDDFISILISLVEPKIHPFVVDADKNLLNGINSISKLYKLKITTLHTDIKNKIQPNKPVMGFHCNPPYTENGITMFLKFGLKQLTNNGGIVSLAFGDSSIGNRYLYLQDFFTKNNLIVREISNDHITYPKIDHYPEYV